MDEDVVKWNSNLSKVYGQTKEDKNQHHLNCDWLIFPGKIRDHYSSISPSFLLATKMLDIKAWAEYVVEWAAKDPYGFLTTVILALTPLFLASAVLSWKLAKMIEAREKEQKKKQKRQENIAKAKRLKKD
ncbi:small integral membrane protein 15 [Cricetulus griseus]|nr:small integral membrane protein 15 [Cricetulus griseus]XP_027257314.1 small integral membrane protein 15 [Cricetulus griseus]ERE85312.1 putative UPF0542 protein C5orf43 like protein [Cricetulus griseus]